MQLGMPRNTQPVEHRLVIRLTEHDMELLVRRLVQRLMQRAMQLRKQLLMQFAMQLTMQLSTNRPKRRSTQPTMPLPVLRPMRRRMLREVQSRLRREASSSRIRCPVRGFESRLHPGPRRQFS